MSLIKRLLVVTALLPATLLSLSAQQERTARMDKDIQQLRYDDLSYQIFLSPPSRERDLFLGLLDNRQNRVAESLEILTPLAAATDISPAHMALVLAALADDNIKLFHYAEAARDYDRLFARYAKQLTPEALQDDGDDNATLKLLLHAPMQSLIVHGPVDLPMRSDPLGSFVADLTVHGVAEGWVLDTGANFSVVSESFAKRLGLTLSSGVAETLGSTGAENKLHTAILDSLDIGGVTLHNVVLLVLPDANLTIPIEKKKTYTIPAILGYPVFAALHTISFTHDHHFLAGVAARPTGSFSPIYMDKLTPLVGAQLHQVQRLFEFDSGANSTNFYVAYSIEFPLDLLHQKTGESRGYGAGGGQTQSVCILDSTQFKLGGREVTLHKVPVQLHPLHTLSDRYYGNFGRDLLDGFTGITLDFPNGRFYLGDPIPAEDK